MARMLGLILLGGLVPALASPVRAAAPTNKVTVEPVAVVLDHSENPDANFWRAFQSPDDAAEAAVQVFLGSRLMCAKCHDHPFEKWVQKDYYGMSAFFSQVGRKGGHRPKAAKVALWNKHFAASKDRVQAGQDMMWVLFNIKEFLFNH
jgi:Protein of unknown function (DUF1549)